MSYVDGFIAAVPNENKEKYIAHAKTASQVFKDCGALKVVECWGDDVPEGKLTSLPMAVKCEASETVVFSWIIWPSKEARNEGWAKFEQDPRMNPETNPMPFDGKRIIFGGFEQILEA